MLRSPVTPLPCPVGPRTGSVFGSKRVFPLGDAPKTPRARPRAARLEKGIRGESAQAHESGNLDVNRIVEEFILSLPQHLHPRTECIIMSMRGSGPNLVHSFRLSNGEWNPAPHSSIAQRLTTKSPFQNIGRGLVLGITHLSPFSVSLRSLRPQFVGQARFELYA